VTGIFRADELFGTASLLGEDTKHREQARALETTTLMTWSRDEIEVQIERHPPLGLALIQMVVGRCLDFEERLQSLALHTMAERVAMTLIRFARLGTRDPDGAVRIPPLTHDVLSGYIGTSREMVTSELNHLRRQGYVRYSRKSIEIYPDALTEHLRNQRVGSWVSSDIS
jgi:CRP/FNR family transcriptional regulator